MSCNLKPGVLLCNMIYCQVHSHTKHFCVQLFAACEQGMGEEGCVGGCAMTTPRMYVAYAIAWHEILYEFLKIVRCGVRESIIYISSLFYLIKNGLKLLTFDKLNIPHRPRLIFT